MCTWLFCMLAGRMDWLWSIEYNRSLISLVSSSWSSALCELIWDSYWMDPAASDRSWFGWKLIGLNFPGCFSFCM